MHDFILNIVKYSKFTPPRREEQNFNINLQHFQLVRNQSTNDYALTKTANEITKLHTCRTTSRSNAGTYCEPILILPTNMFIPTTVLF